MTAYIVIGGFAFIIGFIVYDNWSSKGQSIVNVAEDDSFDIRPNILDKTNNMNTLGTYEPGFGNVRSDK